MGPVVRFALPRARVRGPFCQKGPGSFTDRGRFPSGKFWHLYHMQWSLVPFAKRDLGALPTEGVSHPASSGISIICSGPWSLLPKGTWELYRPRAFPIRQVLASLSYAVVRGPF